MHVHSRVLLLLRTRIYSYCLAHKLGRHRQQRRPLPVWFFLRAQADFSHTATQPHRYMADLELWLASQAGRFREVQMLLLDNFHQKALRVALHVAVMNDHADIVSILLRAGSQFIDVFTHCIHVVVATRTDSADALQTLFEAKAATYYRSTVIAARHGAMKCLQVMILAKADVTLKDTDGETPVAAAAEHGCVDIVHLLVQNKADIDARYDGDTPVMIASRQGHVHVVHLLIRAKADATRCSDGTNESPLFVAAARGHEATVRCILAHVPALAAVTTQ